MSLFDDDDIIIYKINYLDLLELDDLVQLLVT